MKNKTLREFIYVTENGVSDSPDTLPDRHQIEHCEAWLREYAQPQQAINYSVFSYYLKHVVEKCQREYISNGAFIRAAMNLGYRVETISGSPNCYFNMEFRKRPDWRRWFAYHDPFLPWHEE